MYPAHSARALVVWAAVYLGVAPDTPVPAQPPASPPPPAHSAPFHGHTTNGLFKRLIWYKSKYRCIQQVHTFVCMYLDVYRFLLPISCYFILGVLTKTRSYGDLTTLAEHGSTPHRRSSDPNIAIDSMQVFFVEFIFLLLIQISV